LRKLACTFLIMIILAGELLVLGVGHAETPTSGVITSNTTWAQEDSPYTLTGNLIVNSGVILTIEPGVIVNVDSYQLQVNGILNARGTSSNKILLTNSGYSTAKIEFTSTSNPWNEATGSGCIIDNAIIGSVPLVVSGASPKISNNYFTVNGAPNLPITVNGGSPSIVDNIINFPSSTDGIHVNSGSPTISSNLINGQGQSSSYGIYTDGNAYISNNNITDCYSGIWASGQSTIVQNNIMNNAHDGIRTENSASTIQNNAVANNLCGVSGTGNIQYNTITNNEVGIWGPLPTATITNNNIYGNYNATSGITQNIHLTEPDDISLIYNWWGTTDPSVINQTIWDIKNDSVHLGTATFDPFLTQPNPNAPSVPATIPIPTAPPTPSPSSTPTPTETPTDEPTPTPTPYYTDNPTPTPTQTPITPVESPNAILGQINTADLVNVIVILSAIIAAIVIIILINRRFVKKQ
jgi:hypothetical protein